MQRHLEPKAKVLAFTLQSIFILWPNLESKYKVRLAIPNHTVQEKISNHKNKYIFKLPLPKFTQHQQGLIVLLEKKKKGEFEEYVEIGRGQFDFDCCLKEEEVDGLIKGTRTNNKDKIIAKYTYCLKEKTSLEQHLAFSNLAGSRRRERLTVMAHKQTIRAHNYEINQKLSQLTRQFDSSLQDDRLCTERISQINDNMAEMLNQYCDRPDDDFVVKIAPWVFTLLENREHLQLVEVNIKSIKFHSQLSVSPKIKLSFKPYVNRHSQLVPSDGQRILISFYEIIQEQHMKRKLMQIITRVPLRQKNGMNPRSIYLPKNRRIMLQLKESDSSSNLVGYINMNSPKSKIVEFFNNQNEEKGFLIVSFQSVTNIDDYLDNYKMQLSSFEQSHAQHFKVRMKELSQKRCSLQPYPSVKSTKTSYRPLNVSQVYDKLQFQTFHETQSSKFRIKSNRNLQQRARTEENELLQNFISPSKMEIKNKQSNRLRKGLFNESKIKRRLNIEEKGKKSSNNFKLEINSAFLNIYNLYSFAGKKIFLKYEIQGRKLITAVAAGIDSQSKAQWNRVEVVFNQVKMKDILLLEGLVQQISNDGVEEYATVGSCKIELKELRDKSHYRGFIVLDKKMTGYLILQTTVLPTAQQVQQEQTISGKEQYQISLNSSTVHPISIDSSRHARRESSQRDEAFTFSPYTERNSNNHG